MNLPTGLFGVIFIILAIYAIVKVAQSAASPLTKTLWIALILFFPLGGFIIWLLLGPR